MTETFAGNPNGLTPFNPLRPEQVKSWLRDEGILVVEKTGIRVFYDYMNKKIRRERSLEDVMEVEKQYCRKEPFASLGKYIHYIGKRQ
jgi:S-adenosylmethionine-dependent methyltransferase